MRRSLARVCAAPISTTPFATTTRPRSTGGSGRDLVMNETTSKTRAMERMRAGSVLERLRDPDARDRRPLRSGEPTPAMRLESLDRELGRLRRRKRRAEARRPDGALSPAPSSEATPSPSGTAVSRLLDSVSRYDVRRAALMPGIGALLDAADDAVASLRAGVASAGLSVVDWPLVGPSPGWAQAIAAQALAPIVPAHAHRLLERDPAAGFCAGSASYPVRIGVSPCELVRLGCDGGFTEQYPMWTLSLYEDTARVRALTLLLVLDVPRALARIASCDVFALHCAVEEYAPVDDVSALFDAFLLDAVDRADALVDPRVSECPDGAVSDPPDRALADPSPGPSDLRADGVADVCGAVARAESEVLAARAALTGAESDPAAIPDRALCERAAREVRAMVLQSGDGVFSDPLELASDVDDSNRGAIVDPFADMVVRRVRDILAERVAAAERALADAEVRAGLRPAPPDPAGIVTAPSDPPPAPASG